MPDIAFYLAGGTIDAKPYPDPKNPPRLAEQLPESLIPQALAELFPDRHFRIHQGVRKDSKEMTAEDIAGWAKWIEAQPEPFIILTHGTDHMAENARALAALLKGTKKTVIMTGAMVPLANGKEVSDAYDNLHAAVQHITSAPSGLSVVMHGERHVAEGLQKDFRQFRFVNYTHPPVKLTS